MEPNQLVKTVNGVRTIALHLLIYNPGRSLDAADTASLQEFLRLGGGIWMSNMRNWCGAGGCVGVGR